VTAEVRAAGVRQASSSGAVMPGREQVRHADPEGGGDVLPGTFMRETPQQRAPVGAAGDMQGVGIVAVVSGAACPEVMRVAVGLAVAGLEAVPDQLQRVTHDACPCRRNPSRRGTRFSAGILWLVLRMLASLARWFGLDFGRRVYGTRRPLSF
jgi:hypothetical protein